MCPRRLLNVSLVLFDCSACPLCCRGGLNGGGGQEGFGIWRASASAAKNRIPPPSAVADCGALLPSAPSSSVFDLRTSAHSSFLFYGSLICREGAGHRRSIPRKIMLLVLSAFGFQSQKQYHPWAVTPASDPARSSRAGFGVIL